MTGTYIMLIGEDTRHKYKYVKWEAEVVLEKKCRIIGVNLNGWRRINKETCPPVIRNIGAVFVPFSPNIIAYALTHPEHHDSGNWYIVDEIYTKRGYTLTEIAPLLPNLEVRLSNSQQRRTEA